MPPSALASSNSSSLTRVSPSMTRGRLATDIGAAFASWRAMTSERMYHFGVGGRFLTLLALPVIQIGILAMIYGVDSRLFAYALVAQSANAFVMSAIFYVGEILDNERMKGTLVALFLAPCSRFAWLSGFVLAGLMETTIIATIALLAGRYGFGVRFDPNLAAIALVVPLFLLSLWGMGLVFSGIGLLLKKANPFSNLVFNLLILLGGAYFPVAELPDWLRYPARAIPVGYGMQALADAALDHASLSDLAPDLIPLACFAVVLPVLGMLSFTLLERLVRVRGELDVY
jgi:ABC-2 type transport system permease protein